MTDAITASPLTWPDGWPRTLDHHRISAPFHKKQWDSYRRKQVTIAQATDHVLDQLRMMNVCEDKVIISTDLRLRLDNRPYSNQRDPDDPGAAVWWLPYDSAEQHRVIAIDRYDRIADNLYAIGKTIEAMRGIDRWGGGEILERTFSGFTALPSPDQVVTVSPYDVLGVDPDVTATELVTAYRRARSKSHPDNGGSTERFNAVENAAKALGVI